VGARRGVKNSRLKYKIKDDMHYIVHKINKRLKPNKNLTIKW